MCDGDDEHCVGQHRTVTEGRPGWQLDPVSMAGRGRVLIPHHPHAHVHTFVAGSDFIAASNDAMSDWRSSSLLSSCTYARSRVVSSASVERMSMMRCGNIWAAKCVIFV